MQAKICSFLFLILSGCQDQLTSLKAHSFKIPQQSRSVFNHRGWGWGRELCNTYRMMVVTICYSKLLLGATVQREFAKIKSCLKRLLGLTQTKQSPIKETKYNFILSSIRAQITNSIHLYQKLYLRTTVNIN